MDIRDKVIESQGLIIDHLAACENALCNLYSTYAELIPEMQDFWQDLAIKEKIHADILKTLHKQLEQGNLFKEIGRFNVSTIKSFESEINHYALQAKIGGCSAEQAVESALAAEASLMDAHFYDIVSSDSSAYRIIAEKMSHDTHDHVQMVRNKLIEIQAQAKSHNSKDTPFEEADVTEEDKPPAQLSPNPAIHKKIAEVQILIINHLVACEEALSSLYSTYADIIPEMESFWTKLSNVEHSHANALKSMRKVINMGNFFSDIGRFDIEDMLEFCAKVKSYIASAKEAGVSPLQSIENALGIESSLLDAHFYDIVSSDSEEYQRISKRLSSDTHDHVQMVKDKLLEIQSQGKPQ